MNALSLDLRQRIVTATDAGTSQSEVARCFCVSTKTVRRLLQQRRETGTLAAKPRPGRARHISVERHAALAVQMHAHPDASLEEHARLWQQEQAQCISDTTVWRTLRRMNWSHKKRVSTPANATQPDVRSGKSRLST